MPHSVQNGSAPDSASFNGTRKLVRPHLPQAERRQEAVRTEDPLTHAMNDAHTATESTHAEAFYFQKQMQQQTEMTLVLDNGDELHGLIEWYDRCALKLRSGRQRILVYKSGIKYLFKTAELHPNASVMK